MNKTNNLISQYISSLGKSFGFINKNDNTDYLRKYSNALGGKYINDISDDINKVGNNYVHSVLKSFGFFKNEHFDNNKVNNIVNNKVKESSLHKFFRVLLEAILFGIFMIVVGLIVAKIMETQYTFEESCNNNYFYEINLFLTGFFLHIIYVYGSEYFDDDTKIM